MPQSPKFFNPQTKQPLNNQAIVAPCSTKVESDGVSCFTNSACYDDNPLIRATGQLQWKNLSKPTYEQNVSNSRWGTAFFITPDLIMTAGHCFDEQHGVKKGSWLTPYDKAGKHFLAPEKLATMMQLNMDYAYQSCSPSKKDTLELGERSFEITKLVEYRTAGLDYAIAEVKGSPGNDYGYLKFDFEFTKGDICIVQHPGGAPKKLEFGHGISSSDQKEIQHYVNTLGGSSGSAVSNFSTYRVYGVHVSGDEKSGFNTAVHAQAILQVSGVVNSLYSLQNPAIQKEPSIGLFLMLSSIVAVGGGITLFSSNNAKVKKAAIFVIIAGVLGITIDMAMKSLDKTPAITESSHDDVKKEHQMLSLA